MKSWDVFTSIHSMIWKRIWVVDQFIQKQSWFFLFFFFWTSSWTEKQGINYNSKNPTSIVLVNFKVAFPWGSEIQPLWWKLGGGPLPFKQPCVCIIQSQAEKQRNSRWRPQLFITIWSHKVMQIITARMQMRWSPTWWKRVALRKKNENRWRSLLLVGFAFFNSSYFSVMDRFNLKLILEFDGSPTGPSVVEWFEKAERVCQQCKIKEPALVIPLRLTKGAYTVYQQLGDDAGLEEIK